MTVAIISDGILKDSVINENIEDLIIPKPLYFMFLISVTLFVLLGVLLNTQLIAFHVFLWKTNRTTYEYIKSRRNRIRVADLSVLTRKTDKVEVPLEELYEPYDRNLDYSALDATNLDGAVTENPTRRRYYIQDPRENIDLPMRNIIPNIGFAESAVLSNVSSLSQRHSSEQQLVKEIEIEDHRAFCHSR